MNLDSTCYASKFKSPKFCKNTYVSTVVLPPIEGFQSDKTKDAKNVRFFPFSRNSSVIKVHTGHHDYNPFCINTKKKEDHYDSFVEVGSNRFYAPVYHHDVPQSGVVKGDQRLLKELQVVLDKIPINNIEWNAEEIVRVMEKQKSSLDNLAEKQEGLSRVIDMAVVFGGIQTECRLLHPDDASKYVKSNNIKIANIVSNGAP
jgi:hypothetical protein